MVKHLFVWGGMAALGFALSALSMAQDPATNRAATSGGPEPAAAEAGGGHNLLEMLQLGGPVMYPLYLCSILMVTFGIERVISLRRKKVIPPGVMRSMQAACATGDPAVRRRLLDEIQASGSPMGRIIRAGIRRAGRSAIELEKAIEDAGAKEAARMQRNNRVLSGVASISPLLGLLGTVTGLIRSFMTVATSAEALGRTELLAGGIWEALVATAAGLSIAICSLALYFYFQERVDTLVDYIDDTAVELLEKLFPEATPGGAS